MIKLERELRERVYNGDKDALVSVLEAMDKDSVKKLKSSNKEESFRYSQGYSAAIDSIIKLVTIKS